MTIPSLFDICIPREDVQKGSITESDFAADLAQVLRGDASEEYRNPARFFANTHPTRGLKDLMWNVCHRLNGSSQQAASIFRLDTNYGGGKTHALIALAHAARGMPGVQNIHEFIDPDILPKSPIRIAAFDGENADPTNGRPLGSGIRAFTPWGEIAFALAGPDGYQRIKRSDEEGVAPGADTIRELFENQPTLILMDELSVYLRKLGARDMTRAGKQLTAFLTGLFKAVESTPNAALVYTLAIGKDKKAIDAYSDENQFILERMEEAESVSARKAALLDPTEEDETVKVLRRRLFAHIDDNLADQIIEAYRNLWDSQQEHLPRGIHANRVEAFRAGFPLHPELIETLKEKTSTLNNFQRVRGMLRILARTVFLLWKDRPTDACAIHLHHINPAFGPIRQEVVTKLGQRAFVPALKADICAVDGDQPSLAQELDASAYVGLPPYGSYVARTIFFHTLAFNDSLKGLTPDELRYAILSPGTDISFIDDAVRRFVQISAFLDDRPTAPLKFLTEANLTQMIRRQEKHVDPGEVRSQLNDRIKSIFSGPTFNIIPFPSIPNDVPDDAGNGKPNLCVINYDAADVSGDNPVLPDIVCRLYREKGANGELRIHRNNVVFVVVDIYKKDEMRRKMIWRLALEDLKRPDRLNELAEHQQNRIREWYQKSEQELAVSIQGAYRHTFYPSRHRMEGADEDLGHTAVEVQSAAANPGDGQRQIVRVLREIQKIRLPEDTPDSPTFIRDRTPLKKGQITTATLREEFRRDPSLPMLVGDDVFVKGVRQGIEQGEFVYKSGDLVWGKGDPWAEIKINEQSIVMTGGYAKANQIWPRPSVIQPVADMTPGSASGAKPDSDPPPEQGAKPDTGSCPNTQFDNHIAAEGVLKEALTRIWEMARSKKFDAISTLELKIFDAGDGFRLLGQIGTIPDAQKKVSITGDYETQNGSEFGIEFSGIIPDAQPIKEFLEPQLRAAATKDIRIVFQVIFPDGLSLKQDEPERLSERLTKFGTGAAYVSATAEARR
ncbi:MAG: ATP-binding protein [Desulfatirhabdiaceae bacterium]